MNEKDKTGLMIATTKITVRPERRREFFQTIVPLTIRIRKEKGCLNHQLYGEMGDENSMILIEEWESQSRWNEHRKGKNYSVLIGLVSVVGVQAKTDFKLLAEVGGNEEMTGRK